MRANLPLESSGLMPCAAHASLRGRVWPPRPMASRPSRSRLRSWVPSPWRMRIQQPGRSVLGPGVSLRCGGVAVGMERLRLLLLLLLLALLVTVTGRFRARPAGFAHCTLGRFRCDNGDQVPLCGRCDGDPACPDGSDEAGCHAGGVSCGPRGRQCGHGGPCLPFERLCDGQQDCPDNSDESARACGFGATGPPPPLPPCRKDEFRCAPDAGCYPLAWVCDGHPDCPDARDERGCAQDFPSTTATVPATAARTESPESPEVLKTEHWVIVAVAALLISIVAGVAVSVWVRPRAKPLLVHFSLDKASEQLMRKDQP